MFRLVLKLNNDAFTINPEEEVARILREVAGKVTQNPKYFALGKMFSGKIYDINGNDTGYWEVWRKK